MVEERLGGAGSTEETLSAEAGCFAMPCPGKRVRPSKNKLTQKGKKFQMKITIAAIATPSSQNATAPPVEDALMENHTLNTGFSRVESLRRRK